MQPGAEIRQRDDRAEAAHECYNADERTVKPDGTRHEQAARQRHVENALNTLPDTLAEVNLSAQNVTVWTKADADEEVIRKAIRDAGYLPLRTKEKV